MVKLDAPQQLTPGWTGGKRVNGEGEAACSDGESACDWEADACGPAQFLEESKYDAHRRVPHTAHGSESPLQGTRGEKAR